MNLKNILIPALTASLLVSCGEEKKGNLHVNGKFSNCKGDTLYLVDISKREMVIIDSAYADDEGNFKFISNITYAGFYNIDVGKNSTQFATIIALPGDSISLTGDADNLGYTWKVGGSRESERFMELNSYIMQIERQRGPLKSKSDSILQDFQFQISVLKDSTQLPVLDKKYGDLITAIQVQIDSIEQKGSLKIREFIDRDSASLANIPALQLLEPFDNFDYYRKTADNLERKYKDSPNVKLLRNYTEQIRPTCKGQVAPEIALNGPEGRPYKLSSLRGKVVLVDFWASWCGPCRAELPNVVKNYHLYHDKGFEVFSVSLDDNKKDWTDAIAKDGLEWPYHVSDLMRWNSSVVQPYGVQAIPKTFLLDEKGRIIDRDLRGDALSETLAGIFKDK